MLRLSKDWVESLTFCCRCWVDITKSGKKRFQFTFYIHAISLHPIYSPNQGIPKTIFTKTLVMTVRPAIFGVVILLILMHQLLVPQFSGSMGYPLAKRRLRRSGWLLWSIGGRRWGERRKSEGEKMTRSGRGVGSKIEALMDMKLVQF